MNTSQDQLLTARITYLEKELAAKNRELEIEAALERVRSRTMAMHQSYELAGVISILCKEILNLGIRGEDMETCYIATFEGSEPIGEIYLSTSGGDLIPHSFRISFNEDHLFKQIFAAWQNGDAFFVGSLQGEELKNHLAYLFSHIPEPIKEMRSADFSVFPSETFTHALYFSRGYLAIVTRKPVPGYYQLFNRFGSTLQQSYTRFLDLQKAEAQAREAEIELGLERVRVKAMAMQNSDDVGSATSVMFGELHKLGIEMMRCGVLIIDEDQTMEVWATAITDEGQTTKGVGRLNMNAHPLWRGVYQAWKQKDETFFYHLAGDDLKAYYHVLATAPNYSAPQIPQELPEHYSYANFFDEGAIFTFSVNLHPEENKQILKRFTAVFSLTFRRYQDLKTAEAQAREAQIETALEKVRSRSLAMHKSEELQEVVHTVFDKLKELNVDLYTAIIFIFKDGSKDVVWWLANKANQQYSRILVPYSDNPYLKDIFDAKESGKDFFSATYSFEEKNKLFHHLFEHTDFKYVPEPQKKFLLESERATMSVALAKNTGINITSYSRKSFSESDNEILKRFAKVFEQAYTRFRDLQKAEAQARESQIEAALEKVRSRTMAMHKSEELIEVIASVFQQLEQLSFRIDSANLFLNYKENPFKFWMAVPGYLYPSEIDVPYADFALMNLFIREIKSNATLVTAKFNQEEKNEWVRHLIQYSIVGNASDEKKKLMFEAPGLAVSVAGVKNIALAITNYTLQSYSDEENEILKRFAIVFDQTYTRFLDLQKAEAQAREAQVEAALERVRSRTSGMQKSEELRDVIQIVFEQLQHLDFNIDSAHFNLNYKESDDYNLWSAAPGQPYPVKTYIPYFDHPVFITARQAKEKGLDFFTESYTQEEKNKFFEHLFKHAPVIPEERRKYILSGPGVAASTVLMNTISLWIMNYADIPYTEAENAILKRFGKIFEQSHTRFLDLQKAEAQVREAQIEAALERVRSRSMGMQKSEELLDVIQLVYEQFFQLNFNIQAANFFVDYKASNDFNMWLTTSVQKFPTSVHVPYFDHTIFKCFVEAKEKAKNFYTVNLTFEEKNEFHYHFFKNVPGASAEAKEFVYKAPGYAVSVSLEKNIGLCILNFAGMPYSSAENAILQRFSKVFEQTYTRFLDLQKAEAQARDAIKRASVDRVRAEIASMRTTADLERITPLIWSELTTLGVPFIRCGVFIMDEAQQQIETHLSSPDGRAIATFNLPYNAPGETAQILAHWHKKELYKQHWSGAQLVEFTQNLVQQGAITSSEKYLTENHPTDLYLHFLPFLQGMLYAGNTSLLSDDALQLMQNLADAFSTAYARYEDFNKLEAAKQQIEKTLGELKATQHQLIQSEKMASLGELTAGIAHEIQNPLNFVNNFSEVNQELIEELKSEKSKVRSERDEQLEIDILNDIAANEEKINHHGKRADSIVKGMLQHSRMSTGQKELTDINTLADEYLRLAYHGLRAKDKSFNAEIKTDFDYGIEKINVVPQDIGRVLLNLFNNAFYATNQKLTAHRSPLTDNYKPLVSIQTKKFNSPSEVEGIEIIVTDNGNGIPQNIVDKIFQPFFTTKPTGQGTGLGLSLAYDIVKAHGGEIKVETKDGEGSEFVIQLPV